MTIKIILKNQDIILLEALRIYISDYGVFISTEESNLYYNLKELIKIDIEEERNNERPDSTAKIVT